MPVVAALFAIFATIAFVAGVFSPILFAEAGREDRRFQLVDVFSLVTLWQYVLAFAVFMRRGDSFGDHSASVIVIPVFLLMMTAVWFALISTMSKLGVQRGSKRFVAVGLAAPAGIAATLVFFGSTCGALISLVVGELDSTFFASVWGVATIVGLACRAGLQWATRPEGAKSRIDEKIEL